MNLFPLAKPLLVASVCTTFSFAGFSAGVPSTTRDEKAGGAALAAKLRSLQPATNAHFSGVLRIRKADGQSLEVPITCNVVTSPSNWQVTYQTAGSDELPVEKLTVVHCGDKPNQYFYARANKRGEPLEEKPLSAEQLLTPLAQSSFYFADLGLDFLHWPEQNLIKRERPELYKTRACHVLESINPKPAPAGYARVMSWVDKETGGLLKAEAYDKDKKLLKEFSVRSMMKVDNQWQLQEMKICAAKSKACTWIEFDP
jgi:hypothetical protein